MNDESIARLHSALVFLRLANDDEIMAHVRLPVAAVSAVGRVSSVGPQPRSADEARQWILDAVVRRITSGHLPPVDGAQVLSRVFAGTDWPDEVSPFIALASDWKDDPANRSAYEVDIVLAAQRVLNTPPYDSAGSPPWSP